MTMLAAGNTVAQSPWLLGGFNLQRTSESLFVGSQTGALDFEAGHFTNRRLPCDAIA